MGDERRLKEMGGDLRCQEASGGFKMVHNKGRIVSALVSVSWRGLYPYTAAAPFSFFSPSSCQVRRSS